MLITLAYQLITPYLCTAFEQGSTTRSVFFEILTFEFLIC